MALDKVIEQKIQAYIAKDENLKKLPQSEVISIMVKNGALTSAEASQASQALSNKKAENVGFNSAIGKTTETYTGNVFGSSTTEKQDYWSFGKTTETTNSPQTPFITPEQQAKVSADNNKQIAQNLKNLDDSWSDWSGNGLKKQLTKLNKDNVVEVLSEYDKVSKDDKSLTDYITGLSKMNTNDKTKKVFVNMIYNALIQKCEELGVNVTNFQQEYAQIMAKKSSVKAMDDYSMREAQIDVLSSTDAKSLDILIRSIKTTIENAPKVATLEEVTNAEVDPVMSEIMIQTGKQGTIDLLRDRSRVMEEELQGQLDYDGWAGKTADAVSILWGSENRASVVQSDLDEHNQMIDRLQVAQDLDFSSKPMVENLSLQYSEIQEFMQNVEQNSETMTAAQKQEAEMTANKMIEEYNKSLEALQEQVKSAPVGENFEKEFEKEYGIKYDANKVELSIQQEEKLVMAQSIGGVEYAFNKEFADLLTDKPLGKTEVPMIYDSSKPRPQAEMTNQKTYLSAELKLAEYVGGGDTQKGMSAINDALKNAKLPDPSKVSANEYNDAKYEVLRNMAKTQSKTLHNLVSEMTDGLGVEGFKKKADDHYYAAFGTKNDLARRVSEYNHSQQVGAGAVKMGVNIGLIIASGLIPGGQGASGALLTNLATGVARGFATGFTATAITEGSDVITSKSRTLKDEAGNILTASLHSGASLATFALTGGLANLALAPVKMTAEGTLVSSIGLKTTQTTAKIASEVAPIVTGGAMKYAEEGEFTLAGQAESIAMLAGFKAMGKVQAKVVDKIAKANEMKTEIQLSREALGIADDVKLTAEVVKKAFRETVKTQHSDKGGSAVDMGVFTGARDLLMSEPVINKYNKSFPEFGRAGVNEAGGANGVNGEASTDGKASNMPTTPQSQTTKVKPTSTEVKVKRALPEHKAVEVKSEVVTDLAQSTRTGTETSTHVKVKVDETVNEVRVQDYDGQRMVEQPIRTFNQYLEKTERYKNVLDKDYITNEKNLSRRMDKMGEVEKAHKEIETLNKIKTSENEKEIKRLLEVTRNTRFGEEPRYSVYEIEELIELRANDLDNYTAVMKVTKQDSSGAIINRFNNVNDVESAMRARSLDLDGFNEAIQSTTTDINNKEVLRFETGADIERAMLAKSKDKDFFNEILNQKVDSYGGRQEHRFKTAEEIETIMNLHINQEKSLDIVLNAKFIDITGNEILRFKSVEDVEKAVALRMSNEKLFDETLNKKPQNIGKEIKLDSNSLKDLERDMVRMGYREESIKRRMKTMSVDQSQIPKHIEVNDIEYRMKAAEIRESLSTITIKDENENIVPRFNEVDIDYLNSLNDEHIMRIPELIDLEFKGKPMNSVEISFAVAAENIYYKDFMKLVKDNGLNEKMEFSEVRLLSAFDYENVNTLVNIEGREKQFTISEIKVLSELDDDVLSRLDLKEIELFDSVTKTHNKLIKSGNDLHIISEGQMYQAKFDNEEFNLTEADLMAKSKLFEEKLLNSKHLSKRGKEVLLMCTNSENAELAEILANMNLGDNSIYRILSSTNAENQKAKIEIYNEVIAGNEPEFMNSKIIEENGYNDAIKEHRSRLNANTNRNTISEKIIEEVLVEVNDANKNLAKICLELKQEWLETSRVLTETPENIAVKEAIFNKAKELGLQNEQLGVLVRNSNVDNQNIANLLINKDLNENVMYDLLNNNVAENSEIIDFCTNKIGLESNEILSTLRAKDEDSIAKIDIARLAEEKGLSKEQLSSLYRNTTIANKELANIAVEIRLKAEEIENLLVNSKTEDIPIKIDTYNKYKDNIWGTTLSSLVNGTTSQNRALSEICAELNLDAVDIKAILSTNNIEDINAKIRVFEDFSNAQNANKSLVDKQFNEVINGITKAKLPKIPIGSNKITGQTYKRSKRTFGAGDNQVAILLAKTNATNYEVAQTCSKMNFKDDILGGILDSIDTDNSSRARILLENINSNSKELKFHIEDSKLPEVLSQLKGISDEYFYSLMTFAKLDNKAFSQNAFIDLCKVKNVDSQKIACQLFSKYDASQIRKLFNSDTIDSDMSGVLEHCLKNEIEIDFDAFAAVKTTRDKNPDLLDFSEYSSVDELAMAYTLFGQSKSDSQNGSALVNRLNKNYFFLKVEEYCTNEKLQFTQIGQSHFVKGAIELNAKTENGEIVNLTFDQKGKLIRKNATNTTADLKNKTNISYNYAKNDRFLEGGRKYEEIVSSIKTVKDKNGNVVYRQFYEQSDIPNKYNMYEVIDGKKYLMGLAEKTKSGLIVIEKTLKSPSGTKTDYIYGETPDGSRQSIVRITDADGNVILNRKNQYKVIDENHFVTAENDQPYDIKFEDDKVVVTKMKYKDGVTTKRLSKDTELTTDQFFIEIGDGKVLDPNLISLIKKLPASELYKIHEHGINRIFLAEEGFETGAKNDNHVLGISNNAQFRMSKNGKISEVVMSKELQNDLFVLLHELGHYRDQFTKVYKNKELLKTFESESKEFIKNNANKELEHVAYFIDLLHKNKGGAITEVIAETNALLNASNNSDFIAMRSEYLQQYFPKTIAQIAELLQAN
ncbi:MAG: hypothetical protein R3Y28_02770 [Candidatus Gastranaerophilales bacterium]